MEADLELAVVGYLDSEWNADWILMLLNNNSVSYESVCCVLLSRFLWIIESVQKWVWCFVTKVINESDYIDDAPFSVFELSCK